MIKYATFIYLGFIILMIIENSLCSQIHFSKVTQCIESDDGKCLLWGNKIKAFLQTTKVHFFGFPQQTYVITEEGPKIIRDIQIGDQILSYDILECKVKYSRVISWMQKDKQVQNNYQQIKIGSQAYLVSKNQMIGINENGLIKFEPLSQIAQGSQLLGSDLQKSILVDKGSQVKQLGKYALMTEIGNYFILPKNSNKKIQQFILLSCFPQLKAFEYIDINKLFHTLLKLGDWLNINHNQIPAQKQYIHPLLHIYAYIHQNMHKKVYEEVDLSHMEVEISKHKHLITAASNNNANRVRRQALLTAVNMLFNYINPAVL